MKGKYNRGVAQLASASGLGPEGPVFESQYPDKKGNYQLIVAFFLYNFVDIARRYDTGKRNRKIIRISQGAQGD